METSKVNTWLENRTKYEWELIQPLSTTDTRLLGRQLIYFSFLTFLLGGNFIDPSNGLFGVKFDVDLFPILVLVSGLCCIYFLLTFIAYTRLDYDKWFAYIQKMIASPDNPLLKPESLQPGMVEALLKDVELLRSQEDDKRVELELDLPEETPTANSRTLSYEEMRDYYKKMEAISELKSLKYDEYNAFCARNNARIAEIFKKIESLAKHDYLTKVDTSQVFRRMKIRNRIMIFIDVFFPIFFGVLSITLTIYKAYILFQTESFSEIFKEILK